MKVEGILKAKGRTVQTVSPDATVAEAVAQLGGPPRIGALVVCAGGERKVAGMLTERDVIRGLNKHAAQLLAMKVSEIMSRNVPLCSPGDSIAHLMREMTRSRYRHLPVVDNGKLAGLVSIGDVVKHRVEEMELEAGVLRDLYIARR